jgi:hypothetical protein
LRGNTLLQWVAESPDWFVLFFRDGRLAKAALVAHETNRHEVFLAAVDKHKNLQQQTRVSAHDLHQLRSLYLIGAQLSESGHLICQLSEDLRFDYF